MRRAQSNGELAAMDSAVHSMPPLAKLLLTVFYIFVTVSFNKYDITGLFFMLLFPGLRLSACRYCRAYLFS